MATADIYGHSIELEPLRDDEVATDVIVLIRRVKHNDETEKLEDAISINNTENTTGMLQRGMLHEALDAFVTAIDE